MIQKGKQQEREREGERHNVHVQLTCYLHVITLMMVSCDISIKI